MRLIAFGALVVALFPALGSAAFATSFTMTTETADSIGFIDTDSVKHDGSITKITSYSVYKNNAPVPPQAQLLYKPQSYAATASEVWFDCTNERYSVVRLFFYDLHGGFAGTYDKPLLVDQPIPPQTGVEEQFGYVCKGKPLSNKISSFPENETPLQTLIRASRSTMADPRWKP